MRRNNRLRQPGKPGSNLILMLGNTMAMFLVTPIAIDIPTDYNVQQQLQTATEADRAKQMGAPTANNTMPEPTTPPASKKSTTSSPKTSASASPPEAFASL